MVTKKSELNDTGERLIVGGNEQTLTYGEHLSRYLAVSKLVKNKTVIDIASGTGYGTQMIANAGAKKVYGIDISMEAVDYAKAKYSHRNVEYIVGDAEAISLNDKVADIVVSLETIEHLKNPIIFVQEVKRVLKPGGIFIVSTPNDDEFMDGNEFHIHEFQFSELKKIISQNFQYSNFYYQGTYFAASLQSQKSIKGKFTDESLSVTKTFEQKAEKAIYYLAVAGDSSNIPNLEENIVLADRWSTKTSIENSNRDQEKLKSLNDEVSLYKAEVERLNRIISDIYNSSSWKITKPIRSIRRK